MVLKSDLSVWPTQITTVSGVPTVALTAPPIASSYYITGWTGAAGNVTLLRQCYPALAAAATWTVAHHADVVFALANIDFIMSFWIKMAAAGVNVGAPAYLFQKDAADNDYYYFDTSAAGLPIFSCGDSGPQTETITGTTNIADGKWHHIAITAEHDVTTGLKMYVDGTLEATSVAFDVVETIGTAENLVWTAPTGGLSISAFAIYKAADLSAQFATEVAYLYNGGYGRPIEGTETNLVYAANLSDGEGTVTEEVKGTTTSAVSAATWTAGGVPFKDTLLNLFEVDANGSYGAAFPHPIKVGSGCPIMLDADGAYDLTIFGFTEAG